MGRLIILVGIPGSGKSKYAQDFVENLTVYGALFEDSPEDVVIHSSDAIRQELFGDASSQEDNARVFSLMRERTKRDLRADKTVIYDATNTTRKGRKAAIECADIGRGDTIECHIVWAPINTCIRRDQQRDRHVGPEVIDKFVRRWQSPDISEGFDSISIVPTDPDFDQIKYISSLTEQMMIPHDNPHHTLGIREHCCQAAENLALINERDYENSLPWQVATATYWHDIGKPYTKCYKTDKVTGQIDYSKAHYYDHQNVGAYLAYGLFLNRDWIPYMTDCTDVCFISWLICTHMDPFFDSKYYRSLTGIHKAYIDALHAADVSAH